MPNYIRSREPGGIFFFTVVTFQRRRLFFKPKNIEIFSGIIAGVQKEFPFTMDAWVFLPDHLHCLWTLPPEETDYSKRWGLIKARFTKAVAREQGRSALLTGSRIRHGESTIWQRRFWEHRIRDERDLGAHLDYIHFNPVKHGLVDSPEKWSYSSFRKYIAQGYYDDDWGTNIKFDPDLKFGE